MANSDTIARCVNIDWLEVYVFESAQRYPCDADYFRQHGYFVRERDYGTRTYSQMFVIEDKQGNPWIEVRREPQSGQSDFTGLTPYSCHLRLVNRACYEDNPIGKLRDFMVEHDYIFQRIFRIDICYDFTQFDSGDQPARFARRYIERKYRKVNQSKVHAVGIDNWSDFDWETLSWGNPKSMVSTKMYNKTKELKAGGNKKPYIPYIWTIYGLITNPVTGELVQADGTRSIPDVWRVEFSIKSAARNWVVIESQAGKRTERKRIPHTLEMFDSRDKLWARFEELAFHYFSFRYFEYKKDEHGNPTDEPLRKDLCKPKPLFAFNLKREFYQVQQLPKTSAPTPSDEVLSRRLQHYRQVHVDPNIRQACDILLSQLSRSEIARYSLANDAEEVSIMQRTLSVKMKHPERDLLEIIQEIRVLISKDSIF